MSGHWIKWRGHREFTGEQLTRARFRNGSVSKNVLPAYKWRGRWGEQRNGSKFPDDYDYDIVALQVVA